MTDKEKLNQALAALEASTTAAILATADQVKQIASPRAADAFCDAVLRQVAAYRTNLRRLEAI